MCTRTEATTTLQHLGEGCFLRGACEPYESVGGAGSWQKKQLDRSNGATEEAPGGQLHDREGTAGETHYSVSKQSCPACEEAHKTSRIADCPLPTRSTSAQAIRRATSQSASLRYGRKLNRIADESPRVWHPNRMKSSQAVLNLLPRHSAQGFLRTTSQSRQAS